MRLHKSFRRTETIPIKSIVILICVLALTIPTLGVGSALAQRAEAVNAAPQHGSGPLGHRESVGRQDPPTEGPTLLSLSITGGTVIMNQAFRPELTRYTAQVGASDVRVIAGAGANSNIKSYTVDSVATLGSSNTVSATIRATVPEGAISYVTVTVESNDASATRTYRVILVRPADPSVPDITIAANTAEYTAGLGSLFFTLTREGDTADSLDVTVNITQERAWLSDASDTATFAAGDAETIVIISHRSFSSSVTQSGELTATVAAVAGYDASGTIVQIRVISQEGPAVTVQIEHSEYTFDEDAGTVDITVVARAHSSVTQIGEFNVRVLSQPVTATPMNNDDHGDYTGLSETLRFGPADFQQENGSLVGRKTVSLTILDDDVIEGDEYFHIHLREETGSSEEIARLDSKGDRWDTPCSNPYVVTIRDNDGPPVTVQFGRNSYTVAEGGGQAVTVELDADPKRTVVIPITATNLGGATGADYHGVPESVPFNAGETRKSISFFVPYDTIDEDGESVKLSFGSMLPPGVTEGPINETVVSLTERKLTDYTEKPGISVPMCNPNGIFIFWHSAIKFEDDPPPYGWRVERRHLSNGAWITTRFDFLGAESDALQTFNDEYWDWADTTRRSGVDYTYRVRPLDNDGELMEGRMWSRRALALCR